MAIDKGRVIYALEDLRQIQAEKYLEFLEWRRKWIIVQSTYLAGTTLVLKNAYARIHKNISAMIGNCTGTRGICHSWFVLTTYEHYIFSMKTGFFICAAAGWQSLTICMFSTLFVFLRSDP